MAPTPPPFTRARSVSSRIRFFSSALKMRRCGLAATSESGELATKGTAILASLTMFLLAALLCNYGRGKCLIDIGTEGYVSWISQHLTCCGRPSSRDSGDKIPYRIAEFPIEGPVRAVLFLKRHFLNPEPICNAV